MNIHYTASKDLPKILLQSHSWMHEDSFVSLSQSDNCPQIFVRHKLNLISLVVALDGGQCGIDKCYGREL